MHSSIISLGLFSLLSSAALAAPLNPAGLVARNAPTGYGGARPSGKGKGKGKGRFSSRVSRASAPPTNVASYVAPEVVQMTKTNVVYVTPSPVAAAPVASAPAVDELASEEPATDVYAVQKARPQPNYTPAAAPAPAPAAASPVSPAPAPAPVASAPEVSAPGVSAPVASPAPAYSGGSSGVKGGIAFETANQVTPFVGQPKIGWCYNWNANPPANLGSGIEFVPTLWGLDNAHLSSWVSAGNAALAKGAKSVVGFNEPDHAEQANLDVNTAASAYKQYITANFQGKAKLVSPSVTNGPAPMGLAYLENFMAACSDCGIQAVNIHWYDSSNNVAYFKQHIQDAYAKFNLPIWLTEFGTTDGNDQAFLAEVLPWLDSQPFVEKYAYFMAKEGVLLSGGQLSAAGKTYSS